MKMLMWVLVLLILSGTVFARDEESVDLQIIQRIKKEAIDHSQVLETLVYLTDVYGPRLTGSPNYKKAAEWSRDRLAEWGLKKTALEPWGTFGKGWTLEKLRLEITAPTYTPLIAHVKAWTPGTNGPVTGKPVLLDIKSPEDLELYKGQLQDKIVLVEKDYRKSELHFEPDASRFTKEKLAELLMAPIPGEKPSWWARREEYRKRRALRNKVNKFLLEEGVVLVLEPSQREHGTVRLGRGGGFRFDAEPVLPQVVVSIEHYGRMIRMLEKGVDLQLYAEVETKFYEEDSLGYNVIAEIPGTDLDDELVMLGGHLDSWHAGTGATDNAASCSIVMEAVRILKTLGVKPRRTIRIALWSGEEQGLLGSRGYVKKHFADRKTMELKDTHEDFDVYFNLDNGGGKIRGIYLQENDAARPVFEAWFKPFHDMGAETVSIRRTGSTDHVSFDEVGLPGFQFIQDPLNYRNRTHHTNMDVYENVVESDLIHNSIIVASMVYNAAMRDRKIPRKALPEAKD